MGQALLPAHLRALEESILADNALRFSLQQTPSYGVYTLRWNEALLAEGVLSLERMTLVMASGLILELKANAKITPLNLNLPGGTLLPVYVHVKTFYDESALAESELNIIKRDQVKCWLWSLALTTEQEHPDTQESFHLADFEKQPDGAWRLSSRYIPPLGCLGSVPFLKDELTSLVHKLEAYHYQLSQEITAIYLSGSDLVNGKQCLKSVVQIQRFLANLLAEVSPHPYKVYEQLKNFYVDLCFYHNDSPQFAVAPYRHEQLFEVFREILEPLSEHLKLSQTRSPYLSFTVSGDLIQANLPATIREAKDIYLLVQKGGVNKAISLDGFKISALTRLPIVHKFYLQGIPCKRLERPPFQHSFGPEVDIYQLSTGEEWDYALNELALGFYVNPKLAEASYFLYWRSI
jgi:type VI secretion system protein ImpJ